MARSKGGRGGLAGAAFYNRFGLYGNESMYDAMLRGNGAPSPKPLSEKDYLERVEEADKSRALKDILRQAIMQSIPVEENYFTYRQEDGVPLLTNLAREGMTPESVMKHQTVEEIPTEYGEDAYNRAVSLAMATGNLDLLKILPSLKPQKGSLEEKLAFAKRMFPEAESDAAAYKSLVGLERGFDEKEEREKEKKEAKLEERRASARAGYEKDATKAIQRLTERTGMVPGESTTQYDEEGLKELVNFSDELNRRTLAIQNAIPGTFDPEQVADIGRKLEQNRRALEWQQEYNKKKKAQSWIDRVMGVPVFPSGTSQSPGEGADLGYSEPEPVKVSPPTLKDPEDLRRFLQ